MQFEKLLEGVFPVSRCHLRVVTVITIVTVLPGLLLATTGTTTPSSLLLAMERELHLDSIMDLIIGLKDDVVVQTGISHVIRDPLPLQSLFLLILPLIASFKEFLWAQV